MFQNQNFEHYEGGQKETEEEAQILKGKPAIRVEKITQKVTKTVEVEYLIDQTIEIVVKDTQNLNEYATTVAFEPTYLPKLISWIHTRRY